MNTAIQPIKLTGNFIQLEPLTSAHRKEFELITQDEKIWTYFPYSAMGDGFDVWFNKALLEMKNQQQFVFAVRSLNDQAVIGSTRYYDIDLKHRRLKIGHTWYVAEARGSVVNPECKLLLLTHAFETISVNRVELAVDSRNLSSQAALKKLGATQEGILRQHMVLKDGYIRDTVVFSIIKSEWPRVKENLEKRIIVK